MREEYIIAVKEEYQKWCNGENNKSFSYNSKLAKQIEMFYQIHQLLVDEKVRRFANLINYEENKPIEEMKTIDYSLANFLEERSGKIQYDETSNDKYPIYCLTNSCPNYIIIDSKFSYKGFIHEYTDLETDSLTRIRLTPASLDKDFIKRNNIIYDDDGFYINNRNKYFQYKAEYIEMVIRYGQEKAFEIMMEKHNGNYKRRK